MVSRKLNILGLISAAAVVSGVLVGCGGSSAPISNAPASITTTGGAQTSPGNSTTSVSSSTSPQQVQVTTSAGTITVTVPPGQSAITPSTNLCVIPKGTAFVNGLTPKFKARTPGDIFISTDGKATWVATGVTVDANGNLSGNLALTPTVTPIYFKVEGPLTIIGGSAFHPTALTIQELIFGLIVGTDGIASIPSAITMKLPVNGGSLAGGNYVNVTYPVPDYAKVVGSLTLTWPGVTKVQTKTAVNGLLAFSDPVTDGKDPIPTAGITSLEYDAIGFSTK